MLTRRDWIRGSSALALASAGAFAQSSQEEAPRTKEFVIDCHGHYTTEPSALGDYRKAQIAALSDPAKSPLPSSQNQRRSAARERANSVAAAARARHRRDDLLAARRRHAASYRD